MDNTSILFFKNLDYLLSVSSTQITDLESHLSDITGTSKVGYFSRLRPSAEKEGKLPSSEILLIISDYFNCPLGFLLSEQLEFIPKTTYQFVKMLEKIYQLTSQRKIHWSSEQQPMYYYRRWPFYKLSSDIPRLGLFEIELQRDENIGTDYYMVSLNLDNCGKTILIDTRKQGKSLIPYAETLYTSALYESQDIELAPEIEAKIDAFLNEK